MAPSLKLFVAYAHEDHAIVRRLVDAIRQRTWAVYWDEELPAGQGGWQQILERELNDAFGVVVAWSAHAVTSRAVLHEATAARNARRLYGISIDGTDIPEEFADQWAVDLRGWEGDPTDPRLDKILAWPDALKMFHTGLGEDVIAPRPARFRKDASRGPAL
jgi:hypothetical protein